MKDDNPICERPNHRGFPVPGNAGKLFSSVYCCWVCSGVFPIYGGTDSSLLQEFHHIVPRAFGGSDGPTVSLCSGHHALVHKVANRLSAGKNYFDLAPREEELANRVLFLASRISVAESQFSNDPNKRFPVVVSLGRQDHEKMKAIAKKLGCSRKDLVTLLIRKEFSQQFQIK